MVRFIKFVDSDTDQHAYRMEDVTALYVTSATNIDVYVRNATNPTGTVSVPVPSSGSTASAVSDDKISLTVDGGAEACSETLDDIITRMVDESKTFITVSVESEIFPHITAIAYSVGTVV